MEPRRAESWERTVGVRVGPPALSARGHLEQREETGTFLEGTAEHQAEISLQSGPPGLMAGERGGKGGV